jgi:hypothetical protein
MTVEDFFSSYTPGSVKDVACEDFLKDMDSIPLFMKDMPSEMSTATEALQALAYDGTPEGA